MSAETKMEIVERMPAQAIAISEGSAIVSMIERAARDPSVDIDKFERLMAMQERAQDRAAQIAFSRALAAAKSEIQPIVKDGVGHNSAKFATLAAIAKVVDPILSKNGLSYRYRTAQTDKVSVTCIVSHQDGHSEETTLASAPDVSGNKNAIQAVGSVFTYLMRYSLIGALGIATQDDDGKASGLSAQISDDQASELMTALAETKSNLDAFLKFYKIEALPDLPANKFKDALERLEQKRARA